jgi:hypothetical protein
MASRYRKGNAFTPAPGEKGFHLHDYQVVIYWGLKCELYPEGLPNRSQSSPDFSVSTERIAHTPRSEVNTPK